MAGKWQKPWSTGAKEESNSLWQWQTMEARHWTQTQHFPAIAWTMCPFGTTCKSLSWWEVWVSYRCSGIHRGWSWNHVDTCTRSCLLCWYTLHHHTRQRLCHTHPHLEKNKPTGIMFPCKPFPTCSMDSGPELRSHRTAAVLRTAVGCLKPLVDSQQWIHWENKTLPQSSSQGFTKACAFLSSQHSFLDRLI